MLLVDRRDRSDRDGAVDAVGYAVLGTREEVGGCGCWDGGYPD